MNKEFGRHGRIVGITLDRLAPTDVPQFAAILCGEASDPLHLKITSIEISGVLSDLQNYTGSNFSVIFRSR